MAKVHQTLLEHELLDVHREGLVLFIELAAEQVSKCSLWILSESFAIVMRDKAEQKVEDGE
jgi:hypothetical protein